MIDYKKNRFRKSKYQIKLDQLRGKVKGKYEECMESFYDFIEDNNYALLKIGIPIMVLATGYVLYKESIAREAHKQLEEMLKSKESIEVSEPETKNLLEGLIENQ